MVPAIIVAVVLVSLAMVAAASGLHRVDEHERGVVLRLGRRGPLLEPGLRFILPFGVDRLARVDLRSTVLSLLPHQVITSDGVLVTLRGAMHLQVVNPILAVTRVVDYRASCVQVAHAALLDVASGMSLRRLLTDQAAMRDGLGRFADERTAPWGVRITAIDVEEVELPDALRHAMERQAQTAAEQYSQKLAADAELAAAHRLVEAARLLAAQPRAVQLGYLQALTQVSDSAETVVVVPLPVDL
ncbi:MAG: slipin family protein [Candidatus Dormibacteria bacterium]